MNEDLAHLDRLLAEPSSECSEASRVVLEETLHDLEDACAALDTEVAAWRAKAVLAAARGRMDLAEQASARATGAEDERLLYAKESEDIRHCLEE